MQESGEVPPGNAPGETKWQAKRAAKPKDEIRLTPGKGLQDLTCKVEDLVDAVVKTNKVGVSFKYGICWCGSKASRNARRVRACVCDCHSVCTGVEQAHMIMCVCAEGEQAFGGGHDTGGH